MTSRQFALALARDCITGLVVLTVVLEAITHGYGLPVVILAFFGTPTVMVAWIILAALRSDRPASESVQEQDARRRLRVVRTVQSEPQPSAQVIRLFPGDTAA
jgi:hypothetical protein